MFQEPRSWGRHTEAGTTAGLPEGTGPVQGCSAAAKEETQMLRRPGWKQGEEEIPWLFLHLLPLPLIGWTSPDAGR